jgi:LmbE family N-acetylglucosaminyl deacetylase
MADKPVYAVTFSPHPHDTEGGMGGTVAKWTRQGREVVCVICTNGDKGSGNPAVKPEALAKRREKEQLAASKVVGAKKVIFLRQPDLGLEDTSQLRTEILRIILTYRPEVVCTRDPYNGRYVSNPDHRKLGRIVMDMVWPCAQAPNYYPALVKEGLLPHKVKEVLLWSPEQPNYRIDVTDTFAIKEKAVLCHQTQIEDWMDEQTSHEEAEKGHLKFTRDGAVRAAEGTEFQLAEAFVRVMIPPRL